MRTKGAQFIAVIGGLVGLAVACGGAAAPKAAPAGSAPSQPQAQEVVIKASEWKFEPSIVRVNAGKPIKFVFQNWGQQDHDVVFKGLQATEGAKSENASELQGWVKQAGMGKMEEKDDHEESGGMKEMHMDAEAGHMSSFMLTPTKPGSYELVCSKPGHTEAGQKATLIVQ